MFWLPLLLRYATAIATREAMRSSRWNHEKTAVVALVTPFVVLIALGSQVWSSRPRAVAASVRMAHGDRRSFPEDAPSGDP
jgi:hypothetical protein